MSQEEPKETEAREDVSPATEEMSPPPPPSVPGTTSPPPQPQQGLPPMVRQGDLSNTTRVEVRLERSPLPEKGGMVMVLPDVFFVVTDVSKEDGESITRRYSDILWLEDSILRDLPGRIVPLLPRKAYFSFITRESLETQRRSCEMFLNHLLSHSVLRASRDLGAFLMTSLEALDVAKRARATRVRSYSQIFKEIKYQLGNTLSSGKERPVVLSDPEFQNMLNYVLGLFTGLKKAIRVGKDLSRRVRESGKPWREFGQAFAEMGSCETGPVAKAFEQLAFTSDRTAALRLAEADELFRHLDWVLNDLLRYILGAREVLRQRASLVLSWQAAQSDMESKRSSLSKAKASEKPKESKIKPAGAELEEAERTVRMHDNRLKQIEANIREEIPAFRTHVLTQFKLALTKFTQDHSATVNQDMAAWEAYMPFVGAIQTALDPDSFIPQVHGSNRRLSEAYESGEEDEEAKGASTGKTPEE